MKKNSFIFFILSSFSLYAGPDCLSKTKNLAEEFDTKEWHTPPCNCDCSKEAIKGGKCIQCGHLQYARPLTVVETHNLPTSLPQEPLRPKRALEVLVQQYKNRH